MLSKQFKQRLLIGSLGIIAGFLSIYYSHSVYFKPFFFILDGGIISFALLEYYHLAEHKDYHPQTGIAIGCSLVYILALACGIYAPHLQGLPSMVLLGTFLLLFLPYFIPKTGENLLFGRAKAPGLSDQKSPNINQYGVTFDRSNARAFAQPKYQVFTYLRYNQPFSPLGNLAVSVFGIVYLTVPLCCALQINYFPFDAMGDGRLWLAYVIVISKATDIGAYFSGKSLGKNKLAPSISPKKTIEGAIGGVLAALLASVAFFVLFYSPSQEAAFKMTFGESLWLGLVLCILAQLGDLTESILKRDAGVKDSSHLPGFGGVLDLVDSLVFTLPFMYLLLEMHILG